MAKKVSAKTGKGPRGAGGSVREPQELEDLRVKIDEVDRRLIKTLNQRAKLVVRVGRVKRGTGVPIYAPHREAQVLSKVIGMNADAGGPLPGKTIEAIYRELMSGSFALERALRIGYLGPKGSYSHLASIKHFGASVDYEDLHTIDGVFTEVARGHVDYGLVPIENSIGGGIVETLDAFGAHHNDLNIYAEVQIEIHHCLLANCKPSEVTRIYSKPEVFAQCRTWLATQYPQAELITAASSSRAAQQARDEQAKRSARKTGKAGGGGGGVAAIGSELAGEMYGLGVLFSSIEDTTSNITRFFVISRERAKRTSKPGSERDRYGHSSDKTSIMFNTADKPGALAHVLAVFDRAGINLSHIDKRPSRKNNWDYTFFIDAEGHIEDPWFASAVAQAGGLCKDLHVLGSYPKSTRIL